MKRTICIWIHLKSSTTLSRFSLLSSFYLFCICNFLRMCIEEDLAEYFLPLSSFVSYIWKGLCKSMFLDFSKFRYTHIFVCEMEREQHSCTSLVITWPAIYATNSHCIAFYLICVNLQRVLRVSLTLLVHTLPFFLTGAIVNGIKPNWTETKPNKSSKRWPNRYHCII